MNNPPRAENGDDGIKKKSVMKGKVMVKNAVAAKPSCAVCNEAPTDVDAIVKLDCCTHQLCRPCFKKWIKARDVTDASCPMCRNTVTTAEIVRIFGEAEGLHIPPPPKTEGEELDDFTKTWLENEGAKQCYHCQSWIVSENGQGAMVCLCGKQICWEHMHRGDCGCHTRDCFYNNITRSSSAGTAEAASNEEMRSDFRTYLDTYRTNSNSDA